MKAIFKPLLFAILVIAGLRGFAQCVAPNFYYNTNPGGQVNFYDLSWYQDTINGSPVTYLWNFGDGTTNADSAYGVSHTYTTSGTYAVSLNITSPGCDSTYTQYVNVNVCQGAAQFYESITGFGGAYTFNPVNLSSFSGSSFQWTFGDGSTSTSSVPTHTYGSAGGYNVTLIVTDATALCADTVTNYLPVSLCFYPVSIDTTVLSYNPVDIQFQPSLLNPSYSYSWAFGDGGTGTGETTTHSYYGSGTYTATLTISDAVSGCSLPVTTTFGVNLCGDNIYFFNSGNGLTQSFMNGFDSINGTGIVTSFVWNFAGATPSTATGASVSGVVYPAVGTYSACLYATTTGGCIDTVCRAINITPPVYSITGTASKSGSATGFVGIVYLIVQDSVGHLAAIDSAINNFDSLGLDTPNGGFGYGFYDLPVDTYFVKAALHSADPDYANYLPTYYGDVLTWGTATPIALTGAVGGADINLIAGTNPGGPGFVGGYVTQGAGLVLGGANNLSKSAGAPLQGVQINLLNGSGAAVAYTYTDVNGKYTFANLALGSYSIYAEQLNKIPSPLDFTLTQATPTDTGADITINSRTATGVNSVDNVEISDAYPNPVTSTVQLLIGCKQDANATLKLVDVLGRTAFTQQTKLATGQNTLEINMANMAAGVYQLVIQTGSSQLGYKLVKAK